MTDRVKFGLIPWSRWLAGASAAIGRAWERHWADGLGTNGSYGRSVIAGEASWGIRIVADERADPEDHVESPCLMRVALQYGSEVVAETKWTWTEPISSGAENILKYTDGMLTEWADLTRKNCLDLDHL